MGGTFVIFPGITPERWSVARVSGNECRHVFLDTLIGLAGPFTPLRETLAQLGYAGEGVVLALPSVLCLCATVDDGGLRKSARLSGLLFRLEEQFPLAIEEIEADFIAGSGKILGVAVPIQTITLLIEAIETEGIAIANICPAALLAAQEICGHMASTASADVLLLALDDKIDLVRIVDGTISDWTLLPAVAQVIELHLRKQGLNHASRARISSVGCSDELQTHLERMTQLELADRLLGSPKELAAKHAAQVLTGKARPPVELRRGKLASADRLRFVRRPLQAAIVAAIGFLLLLAAAMLWRGQRYERIAATAELQQLEAFRHALPHQTPPLLIASRLLSEERRLEGLSGAAGVLPPSQSALPLFGNALRGLPQDFRFRLLELRFETNRFYLEGQSLDHTSADKIAESLRHSTRLQVDPPHTAQPSGEDVTFEIAGTADAADSIAGASVR